MLSNHENYVDRDSFDRRRVLAHPRHFLAAQVEKLVPPSIMVHECTTEPLSSKTSQSTATTSSGISPYRDHATQSSHSTISNWLEVPPSSEFVKNDSYPP